MSKKQINNRLDQLFEEIKEEEKALETPAPEPIPLAKEEFKEDVTALEKPSPEPVHDGTDEIKEEKTALETPAPEPIPLTKEEFKEDVMALEKPSPEPVLDGTDEIKEEKTALETLAPEPTPLAKEDIAEEEETLETPASEPIPLAKEKNIEEEEVLEELASEPISLGAEEIKEEEEPVESVSLDPVLFGTRKLPPLGEVLSTKSQDKEDQTTDVQVDASEAQTTLSLPVRMDQDSWATLQIVDNNSGRQWGDEEQLLVQQVTDQLTLALENAHSYQQIQQAASEISMLFDVSQAFSSASVDINEIGSIVAENFVKVMSVSECTISLLSPDGKTLRVSTNSFVDDKTGEVIRDDEVGRTESLDDFPATAQVLENKQPLVIHASDPNADPSEMAYIQAQDVNIRSLIILPLAVKRQAIGIVELENWDQELHLSDGELNLAMTLANQAALALDNAISYERVQQAADEMGLLFDASKSISSESLKIEDVARVVGRLYVEMMPRFSEMQYEPECEISLFDDESKTLKSIIEVFVDDDHETIRETSTGDDYDLDRYPATQRTLKTEQPVAVNISDPDIDPAELAFLEDDDIATSISLPLMLKGAVIGVIDLNTYGQELHLTQDEINLAMTIANQAAVAFDNAKSYDRIQKAADEMATIFDVSQAISSAPVEIEGISRVVARNFTNVIGIPECSISLFDPAENSARVVMDLIVDKNGRQQIREDEIGKVYFLKDYPDTSRALMDFQPLVIHASDPDVDPNELALMKEFDVTTSVVLPLVVKGQAIGYIELESAGEERHYSQKDLNLAMTLANQAAVSIENARSYELIQRAAVEMGLLFDASQSITSETLEIVDIARAVATQFVEKLPQLSKVEYYPECEISLLDRDQSTLTKIIEVFMDDDQQNIDEDISSDVFNYQDFPATRRALDNLQPLIVHASNPDADPAELAYMKEHELATSITLPLVTKGEAIGTVDINSYEVELHLSQEEINLAMTLANQAAVAIDNARLFQESQASESEFRALFAAMDDVIFVVDKDTRYLRIAPTNPSGLFLAPEELLGKRMDEILPEETHSLFHEAIQQTLTSNDPVNIEYPLEIDGQITWFDANLSKLDDNQVYWVARNITERKKAEQTLRRQNDYMAAAAEVGRLVTSTLDMDILFRRAVYLLREHFGYYHAAIFTIEEAGFDVVIREATGDAGKEMKEREHSLKVGSKSVVGTATDTGKPFIVNDVTDNPNHRPNPLLPETKAEAAIPLIIGRRTIGALDLQATEVDAFTPEDITVLQLLADQFATAIDNARSYKLAQDSFTEMRELERLKSQFLANMSHELRTPLNSIIGFSRIIIKGIDGPVTDLQQQDLTAIYNSGQHLLGLINDILDLSKIEAGKMELTLDEIDIEKLIKSVMSTVIGLIKDKPVRLEEDIEKNLPAVKADSMRIRQILINLFSNATKFTEEGVIKVAAKREGNLVRISVIDSGPGISKEDQTKLFQAFSQVDASATRATGGSGLGLSISQELVHMHGGEIGLESEVGKGSTFYFTLPFHEIQEIAPEIELSEIPDESDSQAILAIDDDENVITLYERYLNTKGYQVIALTDPKKAVKRAKEINPYAITLDIMMPNYDGWQVLQDLKSNPDTQNFPILICSIVEDSEKGYALGATDYLLKPIIEDDLLSALDRLNDDGTLHDILVIDDDPDDRRLLEKLLDNAKGFTPILAEDGPAGWDMIVGNPPDAVILDLFMPKMDGFEIIDAMQAKEDLREIPVILISGGDISKSQQEKLDSLNHHLIKKGTLDPKELLSVLERSLNHLKKKGIY